MAEPLCFSDDSPSSLSNSDHNPANINTILKSFITSDSDSINSSFNHLLESIPTDSDQNNFIQRTLHVASVLLEAGKRSDRKRSSVHNALVWPLPPELTVKVFAMTDKQSLCNVAATCSLFNECAMDPLCFANIDFSTLYGKVHVDDYMVSTMIKRAGSALRSLKLGDESGYLWNDDSSTEGNDSDILTTLCLRSLSWNDGAPGSRLRRLCLHNIVRMENTPVLSSLSACPSLVDLEIVGMRVDLGLTLESVSKHCPLLECLTFDTRRTGVDDGTEESICDEFVLNCPNITTLALKGLKLDDYIACILMKGFHKLKYVDFSASCRLTGSFLKNLGKNGEGKHLEVMILRDNLHLKEVEVKQFITAVLAGDLRLLRHLDISNKYGLVSDDNDKHTRCITTSFIPTKQLLEQRPNLCLLAEFADSEMEQTTSDSSEYSEECSSDESCGSEETTDDLSEFSEESSSDESCGSKESSSDLSEYSEESSSDESGSEETKGDLSECSEESSSDENGSEESNFEANEENADEQRNI